MPPPTSSPRQRVAPARPADGLARARDLVAPAAAPAPLRRRGRPPKQPSGTGTGVGFGLAGAAGPARLAASGTAASATGMPHPAAPCAAGQPVHPPEPTPPGTRAHLLHTGLALLTEKGYSALGLDELLRQAQVSKGSFYHCFGSKQGFVQALVDDYAAYFARKLDHWFLDPAHPPLQRLRHFIADARAGMARHGWRRGCLVGNLGQEMGILPEAFGQQLERVFQDWQARTTRLLQAAQAGGDLAPGQDTAALAEFFWIGWEGAVLRAKLARSPAALDAYADGFFQLLGPPR